MQSIWSPTSSAVPEFSARPRYTQSVALELQQGPYSLVAALGGPDSESAGPPLTDHSHKQESHGGLPRHQTPFDPHV